MVLASKGISSTNHRFTATISKNVNGRLKMTGLEVTAAVFKSWAPPLTDGFDCSALRLAFPVANRYISG
jgi:hypothetical protein